jgi:putative ABC transport system permease protein
MHAALNMSLLRLCLKNIAGNPFRSWVIAIFAALVAGSAVAAIVLVSGVEQSLLQMRTRLGADIMVVPAGNQSSVEHALLMGVPVTLWMPRAVLDGVRALPQVELASPQLFLSTMRGASCCSVSDMFMIAYDPATDFTVGPWLQGHLERELQLGESIGGHYVFVPEGRQNILIYGYEMELAGKLEPTGSGLDQSMFFTFDTAQEIARLSPMRAEAELAIDPDRISAVMVRLEPGSDAHQAAQDIEAAVPAVTAIESSLLFRSQRASILGLLKSSAALTGVLWAVSLALIGLVASLSTAERRQESAVLRALGIPRSRVLLGLLWENLMLAAAGGTVGMAIAAAAISLFRNFIMRLSGLPFLFPSPAALLAMLLGGLVLSGLSVILATLLPILRLAAAEPGTALKEW